jgi:hypothetical protein
MTSGLRFDTAMYPHEYKNLHGNSRWVNKMNKKRERNTYSQTSRLENPEDLQLRNDHENSFNCAVALCTMKNKLLVVSNLTWLELLFGRIQQNAWLVTRHLTLTSPESP